MPPAYRRFFPALPGLGKGGRALGGGLLPGLRAGRGETRALTGRTGPKAAPWFLSGRAAPYLPISGLLGLGRGKKDGRQSRDARRQSDATFTLDLGFFLRDSNEQGRKSVFNQTQCPEGYR